MASHNQNAFTSQPVPASAINFGTFDEEQGFFDFAPLPPQAPPNDSAKHMSPSGPRGDGLQNHSLLILELLERAVELLSVIKSSQDIRQRDDKIQDDRLVRLNKGMGLTHKIVEEIRKQNAELVTELRTVAEIASTTQQHVDEFLVFTNKTTKQAEDDRVKNLIQEAINQALPYVVKQAIIRVSHQHPSHS